MTQLRKLKQMYLAVGCTLAAILITGPALALAQGPAAGEYDLGPLPQAGGNSGDGAGAASVATSSSDAGGVPVLLIVLVAGAALCTAVAIWRMRTSRLP